MSAPVGSQDDPNDLAGAVFTILANHFFNAQGESVPFELRDKRQTQDDPFDEHIGQVLDAQLPADMKVLLSGKPLVSPDLVVARPEATRTLIDGGQLLDARRIVAIEVKKLNLGADGRTGRASGLDYNSTPPCVTVKVTSSTGTVLTIPGFYLFVVLKPTHDDRSIVHTMALVSGAALNEDVNLYNTATGIRKKVIGIGSYGDGLDRQRPMFVFANPLGWDWLGGTATLIHPASEVASEQPDLALSRKMTRTTTDGGSRDFYCYRRATHATELPDAVEPFPTAANRSTATIARGQFIVDL